MPSFFVFPFVTVLPFLVAISAPASAFRTPIMPSWSVWESERYNVVGTSSHPHSPESISCAMGLLPDVTYRVDTPLATSGCFSNTLSSALSSPSFASCALISRLLPAALSSLIDLNQPHDAARERSERTQIDSPNQVQCPSLPPSRASISSHVWPYCPGVLVYRSLSRPLCAL